MKLSNVKPPSTITLKTTDTKGSKRATQWWKAATDRDRALELISTAAYLKESQGFRFKQAAMYARLYGNQSLFSFIGSSSNKMDTTQGLPIDRPTFNVIQSAVDTLVSRISQNRPSPVFLTDAGDYRQRSLAKKLNSFIQGEFYQTKTYQVAQQVLRDALVEGTGCLKIFEKDGQVALDRVLLTELITDPNESIYGDPRQLYQFKLIDRQVLIEQCPEYAKEISKAEAAFADSSAEASKTVSDLVMVVEGWHLPSGKEADDGRHTIACSSGLILDEEYTKDKFPFVFVHYSKRLLGFWAQGVAEQLMGSQIEINSLLHTISRAIKIVGVPRVFVEDGSKVVKAHFNNEIGQMIIYRGTKPIFEVAPCVPQEMYAQLQRVIEYAYQQVGVSALQASSTKPAGLNSGEAIRSYDDISTDRFAALSRAYDDMFVDVAYAIMDKAQEIAEREGKYSTVYPNKDGTKEIDLPKVDTAKNPFIIQCFNMSSLPRDPAGRMQKVTEMVQSGMISLKEGRRLLDYPDLQQMEKLANASEERIFQILDEIVEDGKYTPPDSFMDLMLATELTTQYINLYGQAKLPESKAQMLRDFFTQVQALKTQASQPQAPQGPAPAPQANPEALPTSPLVPNAPAAAPTAA